MEKIISENFFPNRFSIEWVTSISLKVCVVSSVLSRLKAFLTCKKPWERIRDDFYNFSLIILPVESCYVLKMSSFLLSSI